MWHIWWHSRNAVTINCQNLVHVFTNVTLNFIRVISVMNQECFSVLPWWSQLTSLHEHVMMRRAGSAFSRRWNPSISSDKTSTFQHNSTQAGTKTSDTRRVYFVLQSSFCLQLIQTHTLWLWISSLLQRSPTPGPWTGPWTVWYRALRVDAQVWNWFRVFYR